ncbi:MAG: 3'-5' exonuclease [Myxococcota bacterium]|nr:3'-5' exonuclease [Myxococcota bacterium]
MKALLFDTETTGMVVRDRPPQDPAQPNLVQLGMLLVETEDWTPRARHSMLVRLPEGARIEEGAKKAHGISEEDCARYGVPVMVAASLFNQLCLQAEVIVAHNMAFDRSIMQTALHRLGDKPDRMKDVRLVCTMQESTDLLKLPGRFGSYKWPSLAEAYTYFTKQELVGAHDALVDTEACLAVFQGLIEKSVVQL